MNTAYKANKIVATDMEILFLFARLTDTQRKELMPKIRLILSQTQET